ncbi:flavodoxin domain-containing protein [Rarobacter faecitabidus]|uniref:Menaquinone-dependent protoporphyrinogen oxidase n=1 Tax=Rarobacter faecitabidus TaxID=13243 RepID=A0A542ZDU3_RARFA|nr:flavodoxin domain-containing protein [Rarobacter faecitabidus]TQL58488.1 menaquinone-dependent protoporphyrinogen oxidase [Rarobacter faecitabidus]
MKVLVAVASKHGSTREIAQAIAEELGSSGADVDVRDAADVTDLAGYDAAVIGSAVYMGQWLSDARVLLERIADESSAAPLWLFSSGLSDTPSKDTNSAGARALRESSQRVREHRHFHGALDLTNLNIAERAVIAAARGKDGDQRDFDAIRAWGRSIAEALNQ